MNDKVSVCPYCGTKRDHARAKRYYESDDQQMCRAAMNQLTGFFEEEEHKKPSPDIDPYSTLEYRYEHCRSLEEKMETLATGLTEIYGEFTFEDLEKLEPKNAEKMMKAMLVNGYIHETKYGRYKA